MANSEPFLVEGLAGDVVLDVVKSQSVVLAAAAASNDQQSSSSEVAAAKGCDDDDDGRREDTSRNNNKTVSCDDRDHQEPRWSVGEFNATDHHDDDDDDDDDDGDGDSGFKTPTSVDYRIPADEIRQCPRAPSKWKRRPASTKRKSSSSSSSSSSSPSPVSSDTRRRVLDLTAEVNSMFPKPILDDLHRKIKKARRDHHHHQPQQQQQRFHREDKET